MRDNAPKAPDDTTKTSHVKHENTEKANKHILKDAKV